MKTSQVKSALEEMEFKTSQGSFGQDMDVSIPCQLRFVDTPKQDTKRFHEALDDRGYASIDTDPSRRSSSGDGPYYDGEICSTDHYGRMKVAVMRGDVVRLYPHDDWRPRLTELASITKSIEVGFGSSLEHDPIEQ